MRDQLYDNDYGTRFYMTLESGGIPNSSKSWQEIDLLWAYDL